MLDKNWDFQPLSNRSLLIVDHFLRYGIVGSAADDNIVLSILIHLDHRVTAGSGKTLCTFRMYPGRLENI